MCTTTCQAARWPFCRCECGGANHGAHSPYGRMRPLFILPSGHIDPTSPGRSAMLSPDSGPPSTVDARGTTRGDT
jgi:hypothetical protein